MASNTTFKPLDGVAPGERDDNYNGEEEDRRHRENPPIPTNTPTPTPTASPTAKPTRTSRPQPSVTPSVSNTTPTKIIKSVQFTPEKIVPEFGKYAPMVRGRMPYVLKSHQVLPTSTSGSTGDSQHQNRTTLPTHLTPGTLTPGNLTPGSLTPGSLTPGSLTPGSLTLGSLTLGSLTNKLPGNTVPLFGKGAPATRGRMPRVLPGQQKSVTSNTGGTGDSQHVNRTSLPDKKK